VNQTSGCVQGPVKVNSTSGLRFSNAWAWSSGMTLFGTEPEPVPAAGGYLLNGYRGTASSPTSPPPFLLGDALVVTLDSPSGNGFTAQPSSTNFFAHVALNLFTNSVPLNVLFLDENDAAIGNPVSYTAGNNDFEWKPVDFAAPDGTRSLKFVSGGGSVLGIDNLRVWLSNSNTTPGGNAPEPASFALVGLALLAAGAASRRRG
jgi:MYXO-CTERM domain-containing protein